MHCHCGLFFRESEEEFVAGNDNVRISTKPFLMIHQTKHQRHLLSLYGNDICLLDGTYRTSRYNLPLYVVGLPTNVGYRNVASIIVGGEDKETIYEALEVCYFFKELFYFLLRKMVLGLVINMDNTMTK